MSFTHLHQAAVDPRALEEIAEGGKSEGKIDDIEGKRPQHEVAAERTALDALGPTAERIVPLFITVDPERDTPGQLATYVQSFHPRLIGLTGTPSEIAAVAKEYRVYVRKVPDSKSTAGYSMDHSALIYLIGPDGAYLAHFTPGIGVETLAQRLSALIS